MLREWSAHICGKIVRPISLSLSFSAHPHRLLFVFLLLYVVCMRVLYFCAHMQTLAHICAPRVARRTTKKAKNTFRINCRAGIPRRCTEQNAATLFVARKAGQDGKRRRTRWGGGGTVGSDGTPEGTECLVKMQTSLFSVEAGRERSRSLRDPMLSLRLRHVQKVGRGL